MVPSAGSKSLWAAGWGQRQRGGGRRAPIGRCWAGPQPSSHCTSLFTAMTQGFCKGGTYPQVPDWQGTGALPRRACRTVLCPVEGTQKITATEVTWKRLAPHKFYFLLNFILPGPIHITTCSYKCGATSRAESSPSCFLKHVHHRRGSPTQPCDASQDQPDPPSPTGVGESHGCHITTVTIIPNKGTCFKLPSSCLVLAGLC